MISDGKRFAIEACANRVLESDRISALPVCPTAIAKGHDIEVVPKDVSDRGVSGMLLRNGEEFAIMYATHIMSEGFRRFSIAHELGHYFLDGHAGKVFESGDTHTSHAGFSATESVELEADHFAASLLMPRKLFVKASSKNRDGLDAIEKLSEICKTSRVATAIRYAETTDAPIAIVVSRGRFVDYCFMSKSIREFRGISWPKKGSLVPKESATYALNMRSGAVAKGEREEDQSDFSIWFGGCIRYEMSEQVLGLGEYGRTLTVLTSESMADDDEAQDDEDDDSPRFR